MDNNGTWVGRYVKFIGGISHDEEPEYYPLVGTFGIVLKEDGGEIRVQWPHGTTSDDDIWWCFKADVEIMSEANSENILRVVGKANA